MSESARPHYPAPVENAFGDRKRYAVIRQWIADIRVARGRTLSVLDFGCGTGSHLLLPLAIDGDRFHGVDIHEPSIAEANAHNVLPNVTFGTETIEDLLSRGAFFDVIICSEVLEHVPDPDRILDGFARMLTRGGVLIVTVPNGYGPYEQMRRVERVLERTGIETVIDYLKWPGRYLLWRSEGRGIPPKPGRRTSAGPLNTKQELGFINFDNPHIQFYRIDVLRRHFSAAGFMVEEVRGRSFVCGPYLGFFLTVFARFPGGHRLLALNNRLADLLPLSFASDWMFRLRKGAEPPQ